MINITLEQLISICGEIPLCQCNCGQKVNVFERYYNLYKRGGYPKFIVGHNKPMKGHKQSQKQRTIMKEKNPMFRSDVREVISKMMKEYANRPEVKQRLSKNSSEYHNTPDIKKLTSERFSKLMNDPEHKEYMREIIKKYANFPESKERVSKTFSEYNNRPEIKQKLIQRNIENWKNKEYREKQISRLKKLKGKLSPGYGRIPSHDKRFLHLSPLQGELKFHTWDYLYALYLDSIGEPYLYELFTFELILNNRETTYTPDFYLPDTDTFVEVKGYWRDDAELKFNKLKEIYPNIKINLLMKQDLQNLGIKL